MSESDMADPLAFFSSSNVADYWVLDDACLPLRAEGIYAYRILMFSSLATSIKRARQFFVQTTK